VIRDYRVLERGVMLQTVTENTHDPIGKGIAGGDTGGIAEIVVWPGEDKEVRLTERVTYFGPLDPGDEVSVRSPGGGGWGPPRERDSADVAQDVRDELLARDQAAEVYGVALTQELRIDVEETERLRSM
jgi:N-methylhydantoinase B